MRGQVLGVDTAAGEGQIAGDDGQRYVFRPEDWSDRIGPSVGALIDFESEGRSARRIYRQPGTYSATPPMNDRNRFVAALLAFFFGIFGVHRFYLGQIPSGVVMVLITCTLVGAIATGIWGFIDTVRYLAMSDADFAIRYRRAVA